MEIGTLAFPRRLSIKETETIFLTRTAPPTANWGVLNMGDGRFDDLSSGSFTGVALGTYLAINAATGFGGNLVDAQLAGVSKFSVSSSGAITAAGALSLTGASNQIVLDVNGTLTWTPSTTRTITLPDVTGTVITTGNLTSITATGTVTSGTWQGTAIDTTRGGTGLDAHLAANGQLLVGNGAGFTLATLTQGANITITNAAGSITIASTGGGGTSSWTWVAKTANYTITTSDTGILGDATSASITITLPTAVGATQQYTIKRKDATNNTVTVATTSSQTIDGATTYVLYGQNQGITVASDNANWYIV